MNNNTVKPNSEIRALALGQLKGKWTNPVLTALVYAIVTNLMGSIPTVGSVLSIIFSGTFAIGICFYHLQIAQNLEPKLEDIFEGFKQLGPAIIASILTTVIVGLGCVLLIFPGIIAALGLSQTFYIMADKPGISGIDAMKQSWEMTKGHKQQLLMLGLSFTGWALLSIFTLFIGLLWLMPYMYVSFSHFYLQLKGEEVGFRLEDHLIE